MLIDKLTFIALTLVLLCVVATGAGNLPHAFAINDEPKRSPTGQPPPTAAKPDDLPQSRAPGRMFVVGRVLDPEGKPVPDAAIAVHARSLAYGRAPYLSRRMQTPIGDARADTSGRFRIDAPRTSSSRHESFGAVALAPGYGVGWVELDPDDDQPTADIMLRPEYVIYGRLFDVQGRPVPDVALSVASIRRELPQARAGVRSRSDGVFYGSTHVNRFPAWPKPVTTDAEGRFTVRGLGRDLHAALAVHHSRFALQSIDVGTDGSSQSKPMTAALAPSQILNVRVTYADTGKPVPHAPLRVMASRGRVGLIDESETDAEGRSRVNSWPADQGYNVWAYTPEGEPYLIDHRRIEWPKGSLEQSLDLILMRGVSIHGKVAEEGSGKPVPGAMVDFVTRAERPNGEKKSIILSTASDGSFQLGADPSPGYLFIKSLSDDYMLQAIGYRMVQEGQPGGRRIYTHAQIPLDLKPGIGSQEVNVVLRRAATVKGQVVGPDGQRVRDAWMIGRVFLDPRVGVWRSWTGRQHGKVRNGRFEIHGLDPDNEIAVYFLEPKRKLGGVVNLSGKSAAGGPITVRLEPCGTAKARLVDPDGKPVAGRLRRGILAITMVITPSPSYGAAKDQAGALSADEAGLNVIDPVNYQNELVSDADGRFTLPVLIPGATYRVIDDTTAVRGETGPALRKEFTVKPGETVELGDIRIEKPPA